MHKEFSIKFQPKGVSIFLINRLKIDTLKSNSKNELYNFNDLIKFMFCCKSMAFVGINPLGEKCNIFNRTMIVIKLTKLTYKLIIKNTANFSLDL